MNKCKLIGTNEYCKKILQSINEIKYSHLLGMVNLMDDLAYNVRDKETIINDKDIYNEIRDKLFDLISTLENVIKEDNIEIMKGESYESK